MGDDYSARINRTLAMNLKVDPAAYDACIANPATLKSIEAGMDSDVTGTPTSFLVNNKTGASEMIQGQQPLANFTTIIDAMLKKSK